MPPYWVLEQCEALGSTSTPPENAGETIVKPDAEKKLKAATGADVPAIPANPEQENETPTGTESSDDDKDSDSFGSNHDSLVKFNLVNQVHEVRGRYELTPQDFSNTWHQASDFARISSWNRMTVKLARHSKGCIPDFEQEHHCLRGLEHRLKGASQKRHTTRTNAIYAVLTEQAKQRKLGVLDKDKIAQIYHGYTFECEKHARQLGIEDERDAKDSIDLARRSPHRRSSISFDELDLNDLNMDSYSSFEQTHSEARPRRRRAARGASMPISSQLLEEEEACGSDIAHAHPKGKKKSLSNRIAHYLFRKKPSGDHRKAPMEPMEKQSSPATPAPRRYRRSSM